MHTYTCVYRKRERQKKHVFSLDTVCLCSCLDMWVWNPHRADDNIRKHFCEVTINLLETVSQSQTVISVSSETSLVQDKISGGMNLREEAFTLTHKFRGFWSIAVARDKAAYHRRESMVGHSCSPMAARTGKGGGQGQYLLQEYAHGDLFSYWAPSHKVYTIYDTSLRYKTINGSIHWWGQTLTNKSLPKCLNETLLRNMSTTCRLLGDISEPGHNSYPPRCEQ